MRVTQVEYKRLVNTGTFEHQSLGIVVTIEDDETPHDAVKRAKAFVDAELLKRPATDEWDSAQRVLQDVDNHTGWQVREARRIVELCERPEEIPF